MDTVKLKLTTPQLKSLQKGKAFQLSHIQLSGNSKGIHEIEIKLPSHHTKKMMKNMMIGRGYRFPNRNENDSDDGNNSGSDNDEKGGSIRSLAKKAKDAVKAVASKALPMVKEIALPIVKDVATNALKSYINSTGTIPIVGGQLKSGIPQPMYTEKTQGRIQTHGLTSKMSGTKNGLMHGGSFLPLG